MSFVEHPSEDVRSALLKLSDALCEWERNTGQQSVLALRDQSGYVYRAVSGKPVSSDLEDVSDEQLVRVQLGREFAG